MNWPTVCSHQATVSLISPLPMYSFCKPNFRQISLDVQRKQFWIRRRIEGTDDGAPANPAPIDYPATTYQYAKYLDVATKKFSQIENRYNALGHDLIVAYIANCLYQHCSDIPEIKNIEANALRQARFCLRFKIGHVHALAQQLVAAAPTELVDFFNQTSTAFYVIATKHNSSLSWELTNIWSSFLQNRSSQLWNVVLMLLITSAYLAVKIVRLNFDSTSSTVHPIVVDKIRELVETVKSLRPFDKHVAHSLLIRPDAWDPNKSMILVTENDGSFYMPSVTAELLDELGENYYADDSALVAAGFLNQTDLADDQFPGTCDEPPASLLYTVYDSFLRSLPGTLQERIEYVRRLTNMPLFPHQHRHLYIYLN